MKGRLILTPMDENWEENRLASIIIDVHIEKNAKQICIVNGGYVSIPTAQEYAINVRESGQHFNDYFEVFSSSRGGCTIKTKKPKTKIVMEREWLD